MAIRSDFWMTGFAKLHFPITIGGMQKVGFGIIGGGLMGREFASAVARWGHLLKMPAKPSVEMVSGLTLEELSWFAESMPTPPKLTTNWRDILANPDVDVVYASLPHNMHEEVFTAVLKAGKHLMGEKPFGIDQKAFNTIAEESRRRPKQLVRVASQMHFFPAAQKIGQMIESGEIGQVIEVRTGFLHSSDLDPLKPINWKRQAAINGAYGAMGDLGMHACSMPIRAGWKPLNVRAILRKVVKERPDRNGKMQPCDTPDNATLFCEMQTRLRVNISPGRCGRTVLPPASRIAGISKSWARRLRPVSQPSTASGWKYSAIMVGLIRRGALSKWAATPPTRSSLLRHLKLGSAMSSSRCGQHL